MFVFSLLRYIPKFAFKFSIALKISGSKASDFLYHALRPGSTGKKSSLIFVALVKIASVSSF